MSKRSGKFYYKNEKEVMKQLGLEPTKGSGSGWIEKEDGQNNYVLAQLKSTDAESIRVKKYDIDLLEYNANISKKLPVFVLQFLSSNDVYLLVKPIDLADIADYLETGIYKPSEKEVVLDINNKNINNKIIKTSNKERANFYKQKEEYYKNGRRNKN